MAHPRLKFVQIRLNPDSPGHQEIIDWLASLPVDGRGVRHQAHIVHALLEFIRGRTPRPSTGATRRKSPDHGSAIVDAPASPGVRARTPEGSEMAEVPETVKPNQEGVSGFSEFAMQLIQDLEDEL
jgi:hypothetical protein